MHNVLMIHLLSYRSPSNDKVWHPFDSTLLNYLSITSNHTKMKTKLRADKMIFWINLIPKLILSYTRETTKERRNETEMIHFDFEMMFWVFTACSIILMIIFLSLLFKMYQIHHKSAQHQKNVRADYVVAT